MINHGFDYTVKLQSIEHSDCGFSEGYPTHLLNVAKQPINLALKTYSHL